MVSVHVLELNVVDATTPNESVALTMYEYVRGPAAVPLNTPLTKLKPAGTAGLIVYV